MRSRWRGLRSLRRVGSTPPIVSVSGHQHAPREPDSSQFDVESFLGWSCRDPAPLTWSEAFLTAGHGRADAERGSRGPAEPALKALTAAQEIGLRPIPQLRFGLSPHRGRRSESRAYQATRGKRRFQRSPGRSRTDAPWRSVQPRRARCTVLLSFGGTGSAAVDATTLAAASDSRSG